MNLALVGHRPKIFLSYRRGEALALADQLFSQLTQRGCMVYVDRFTHTPGRHFPSELAEELADKGVILLLETPNAAQSSWTMWEVAFARRFGIGRLALNVNTAPHHPGIAQNERRDVNPNTQGELSANDLNDVCDWIVRHHALAALHRSAFYSALVAAASAAKNGSADTQPDGTIDVSDAKGAQKVVVYPSGRPGQLEDAHALIHSATASASKGAMKVLAGQHQHLPRAQHEAMRWLALGANIKLAGPYGCYRMVKGAV